jgi:hypothetical protein
MSESDICSFHFQLTKCRKQKAVEEGDDEEMDLDNNSEKMDLDNDPENMDLDHDLEEVDLDNDSEDLKVTNTGLAHPMKFFGAVAKDCMWCSYQSYGVLSPQFKMNVLVYPVSTKDGPEWHEKDGTGNRAEGHPPSQMCLPCCAARVQIIVCSKTGHDIQHIQGAMPMTKKTLPEYEAAAIRLVNNEKKDSDAWCSICLNLATHSCQTPHTEDSFGDKLDQKKDGCGLKLCDWCTKGLVDMNGNFQAFITKMVSDDRDKRYKRGPRPDAELLSEEGLLYKNLIWRKRS